MLVNNNDLTELLQERTHHYDEYRDILVYMVYIVISPDRS